MYNNTIKAENKIISSEDLTKIFQAMGETLKKYQRISTQEEMQNRMVEYSYQKYTFKDSGSKMKAIVDFYDNTNITFDNYENFMSIFFARLEEIKSIDIYYALSYEVIIPEPNRKRDYYMQSIQMYITENKIDITLNLKSDDPKLDDIYKLIEDKILNAPEKYDNVIKNKTKILNTISLSKGFIPATIITSLLLFVPIVNKVLLKGYIAYPLCVFILAYIIGSMISSSRLEGYYSNIIPDKKYAGYDSVNNKSIYTDDIEKFMGTSEVLIGKKTKNLINRENIKLEYKKYKELFPKELLILLALSVIVIIVGLFI